MRHICLYIGVKIFSAGGCTGPPEVVQEALADLKRRKDIKTERQKDDFIFTFPLAAHLSNLSVASAHLVDIVCIVHCWSPLAHLYSRLEPKGRFIKIIFLFPHADYLSTLSVATWLTLCALFSPLAQPIRSQGQLY